MFLAIPFDQQVTDTYFVIAHFHYIIFGAAVFPIFGGMYYWFPKVTGKLYFERPGQISFWIIFVGTNLLFFPMHIVGLLGMPRRIYTYPAGSAGRPTTSPRRSAASSRSSGILLLLGNLVVSYRRGRAGRARPVARPDARVDDELAAARRTTSPSSRRSRARTRTGTPADRAADRRNLERRRDRARAGPPAARDHAGRRRLAEIVEMPHELAVAGPARRRALARLHDARARAVRARPGVIGLALRCSCSLGWHCAGAGRRARTRGRGGRARARAPRAARRRRLVGDADADRERGDALRRLIGTYFYLRFRHRAWPPRGHARAAPWLVPRSLVACCSR